MARPYHILDWADLDRLVPLQPAYVGLQIFCGSAVGVDFVHVASVLDFLPGPVGLRLVKDD